MSKQFIDEVNQQIQEEKIVRFWHKFKYLIIGGAIGIVAVTGGYTWYTEYVKQKLESQNVALDRGIKNITSDSTALDSSIANGAEGVKFIAVINKANALTNAKKYGEAIDVLTRYADNTQVQLHREYAGLASVWVAIKAGNITTLGENFNILLESEVFGDLARLTKAEVLLKSGNTQQATEILQSIIDNPTAEQEYKGLATAILRGL